MKLFAFFDNLGLKIKLLLMMAALSITSISLLFVIYNVAEKRLILEVRRYTEELTSAIQISVEQLTTEDKEENEDTLKEYVDRLKKKGIHEISILNNEMEIIASSNPKRIGRVVDAKSGKVKNIEGSQDYTTQLEGQRNYNLMLPVTVGDEQLGYIHIAMKFDDFADFLRSNNYKRLIATTIVFAIGIVFAIFLSNKYVMPINKLAKAAQRIAAGDLKEIGEVKGSDEIGELTRNFNEMVKGLRENKMLEERLRKAEHLSQIGQLASGIAHEIRNPLNFINLGIDHLKSEYGLEDSEKRKEFESIIASIKAEIYRLNSMINNFLEYGRPITLKVEKVFIGDIIEEVIKLAEYKAHEQKIELKVNLAEDITPINIDKQQIKACLMNIILNAIQAMPDGGEISVNAVSDNSSVVIRIEDNGGGIAKEDMEKIFEPYFTTKIAGIGLGLAITKRIIEEHNGSITIESRLGHGTAVAMEIPTAQEV